MEELKCQVCGFTSQWSLVSHITRVHKLTCKQYKDKYNVPVQLIKPSAAKKSGQTFSKKYRTDKDFRDKMKLKYKQPGFSQFSKEYWINKGLSEADAIVKISKLQKRSFSDETREKLSKQCTGVLNPSSYESVMSRYSCTREEAKQHMPCTGRLGEKHPMYGKHHTDASLEKIAQSLRDKFKSGRLNVSSLERAAYQTIKDADYEVHCNSKIKRYIVDFQIDKLVIEMDGDFWHCNPSSWKEDDYNKMLRMTAKDKWQADSKKTKALEALGYTVVRVWEADFYNNINIVKDIIDDYFETRT